LVTCQSFNGSPAEALWISNTRLLRDVADSGSIQLMAMAARKPTPEEVQQEADLRERYLCELQKEQRDK